jgi:prolyl-tRNA editing enzyme YbaK/EbsC (Cys-tRNA(Pro) deacylase)
MPLSDHAVNPALQTSAARVQAVLAQSGLGYRVVEFSQATRTAQQAADAIGCQVAQIAKSIVFRTKAARQPVLVITSGSNRVDEAKVAKHIGEAIEKADAAYVRETTGFVIGGVPPIAHLTPVRTLVDEDLLQYAVIWAAAGTPNAVFELDPPGLLRVTGSIAVDVKS